MNCRLNQNGSFSFDVPIRETAEKAPGIDSSATVFFSESTKTGTQKNLHVIAQITEGNISVIEWYLRPAD